MLRTERCGAALALVSLLALLVGCDNPNHPTTYPVTGTVTYKGAPVEGAEVIFQADGAPLARGNTDAAGKFALRTFEPGDGAVSGNHRVSVVKMGLAKGAKADDPYALKVNILPAKYGKIDSSPIRKDVGTGTNEIAIELVD